MGYKHTQLPEAALLMQRVHGIADDFYEEGGAWTTTATDSGTSTVGDAVGGTVVLAPSDGTVADNDEIYFHQASETFKFADGKAIEGEVRIQFSEAATDDANVIVALLNGWAANALQDNGAGVKADASGCGFFKVDGGTNWKVFFSDSTTQEIVELTAANSLTGTAQTAGGASYQRLGFKVLANGTRLEVQFFIDDVLVYRMADKTFANATEMELGIGAKNGGANNESIVVDYAYCFQAR